MAATKSTLTLERLAKPTGLIREAIRPWTHLPPSAKEQFAAMRETAHFLNIQTDNQNGPESELHLALS